MSLIDDKAAARARLKAARAELPPGRRVTASAQACRHLVRSEAWPAAGRIALFCPLPEELDPTALAVYAPGPVAYPQVAGDALVFREASSHDLVAAPPFGVREPTEAHPVVSELSLVVVPGLGFTKDGLRIGYGRGFYDRALVRLRADNPSLLAVGAGFSVQLVDALPTGPHDARLDAIVTEEGVIWADGRPA